MITELNQISLETEEGKLLLAALAKITTESQTDKTPVEVIAQLNELKDNMSFKDIEIPIDDNIKEANSIIADQDRIIGMLTRKTEHDQDIICKYRQSQQARKEEAGYSQQVSFDVVWEEVFNQSTIPVVNKLTFRKAVPKDIVVDKTVFLLGDENEIYTKTIKEVLRPDDQWKAFYADDGCSYGLEGLYICELQLIQST